MKIRIRPAAAIPAIAIVMAVLLTITAVRDWNTPSPTAPVRVVRASGDQYKAARDSLEHELAAVRGQLRGVSGKLATAKAMLRGLEERVATTVTHYDGVYVPGPRDTLMLPGTVIRDGMLSIMGAIPDTAGWLLTKFGGIDVRDCDDALTFVGASVICDRARLGHLEVYGAVGGSTLLPAIAVLPRAELGLEWSPSFRSTWAVRAYVDTDRRATAMVKRGFRIF